MIYRKQEGEHPYCTQWYLLGEENIKRVVGQKQLKTANTRINERIPNYCEEEKTVLKTSILRTIPYALPTQRDNDIQRKRQEKKQYKIQVR